MAKTLTIQEISDRMQIHDVLLRFNRGLDRLDAEMVASVYHDDAIDHHGPFEELGKTLAPKLVDLVRSHVNVGLHCVSNVSIDLDGDVAHVESYTTTFTQDKDVNTDIGARCVDRFERRNGEWKIADRIMILEYVRTLPVGEPHPMLGMFARGARDRSDPSYRSKG